MHLARAPAQTGPADDDICTHKSARARKLFFFLCVCVCKIVVDSPIKSDG